MDERLLFERFHEALDVDPRPAAYERMRNALIAKTSTPRRRAVFQMRWTRMGFRLAATVVLVAIAATVAYVFVSTHREAQNNVPAGSDSRTVAYRQMLLADDTQMGASTSNHCHDISDTGCAAAVARVNATLQHWLDDLSRAQTPSQYRIVDAQLRLHISAAMAELNEGAAAVNTRQQDVLNAAIAAAQIERGWIDSVVGSIAQGRVAATSVYTDFVRAEKSALDACPECQQATAHASISCTRSAITTCQALAGVVEGALQGFQVGVIRYAAPPTLSAKDQQLQSDLATASTATLAMARAALSGDQARFDSARASLTSALLAVDVDSTSIMNS